MLLDVFGSTHLVGIGGAGMSVVAQLLAARGVDVSGCDRQESAVVSDLRSLGIHVDIGHDAAHTREIDTLVISTAVRADNPDVVGAKRAGVKVMHRSEALAELMNSQQSVAVAGTHGKTTTTAMLAAALHAGGVDASIAVGARLASGGSGAHVGSDAVFIAEADESDGSFLRYRPDIAIITNLEPDHLDYYGTPEAFFAAFAQFITQIPPGGTLILGIDDDGARQLLSHANSRLKIITYGYAADADVQIHDGAETRVSGPIFGKAENTVEISLKTPGKHNILNAVGALTCAAVLGANVKLACEGLAQFAGAERRFHRRGEAREVLVIDDYAHHPTEVRAVLQAAAEVAGKRNGRVIAVFQPHLPSRTRIFAKEFAQELQRADQVIIQDVYLAREDYDPDVTGEIVANEFANQQQVQYVPDQADVPDAVADLAKPGDVVLTLGAGDITEQGERILEQIDLKAGGSEDRA